MQNFFSSAGSVLLTILAAVFVFGLVIFIHELGHFMAAKFSGIKVNEFAMGMGPRLLKWKRKETQYSLRLLPIGGYVSMEGEDEESDAEGSFSKAPVGNRILVVVAGAVMNLLLGFLVLVAVVCMQPLVATRTVAEFSEGALTQASGLQVNDTIVAVNGRRCYTANDLSYEFARTQDGAADLTVIRDGEKVELKNVQFQTTVYEGQRVMQLDFKYYGQHKTFANVIQQAGNWFMSLGRSVVLCFVDLITGRAAINQLSGPVGIVSAIGQAASLGFDSLLLLMALITINLGIFNVLPLPALDGGRLLLLIIEAIRRKPIKQKYEMIINTAGFALLMLLMLFVTFNDITRLIG